MGFCGKHCSRRRQGFSFLEAADDIAANSFFYRSPEANVSALRNLRNYIRRYHSQSWKWGDDINEHWLFDVLRRLPPSRDDFLFGGSIRDRLVRGPVGQRKDGNRGVG